MKRASSPATIVSTITRPSAQTCVWIVALLTLLGVRAFAQVSNTWPQRIFAPYVDFANWPPYDIVGAGVTNNLHYCTLAFIVADPSQDPSNAPPQNIPAWGGYTAYSTASQYRLADINSYRALGGDVIISFGGQANTELANYITDPVRLKAAYASVISNYSATRLDFDIEGTAVTDHAGTDRRSVALASLQADAAAAGKELQVWLTLPVEPDGLTVPDGVYQVQSALSNHVVLGGVNIMTMDYGDYYAPNPAGNMGNYAIASAASTFAQLKAIYQNAGIARSDAEIWGMIGLTPMIGYNDAAGEIFDVAAASQLTQYAQTNNIGLMAFWSLVRDNPLPSGQSPTQETYEYSGVNVQPFDFTKIFQTFTTGGTVTPSLSVSGASVVTGTNGFTNLVLSVLLSPPATGAVTVAYATVDGSATSPANYFSTNGILTFTAGQVSNSVWVTVAGSTNAATNAFFVNLSNASGASISQTQAIGTIINPGLPANSNPGGGGGGSGECAVTSQWAVTYDNGSSFQANLTLSNPSVSNITINLLEFDATYSISYINQFSYGNAFPPAPVGGHYSMSKGWPYAQPVLPAGGSLQFLFQGVPGGNPPAPANLKLNGILLGDCGGATNAPDYYSWAYGFFGCTNCPQAATNADPDGDGMNNLKEFLAGTNPTNATSALQIMTTARQGGDVVITWKTAGGTTDHVLAGGTFSNWTDLSGPLLIPGSGDVTAGWTNFGGATNLSRKFYRILSGP